MDIVNMGEGPINIDIVKYKYWDGEGKTVRIVGFVKVKSPVTNVWFQGISYKDVHLDYSETYVRPLVDFIKKFKPNEALEGMTND